MVWCAGGASASVWVDTVVVQLRGVQVAQQQHAPKQICCCITDAPDMLL
jgi:hypothetical protein